MDYRYLDRMANEGGRRPSTPPGEHPKCAYCGYDLFGGVSDRCPECGNMIDTHAMKDQSEAVKAQFHQFEESLRFAPLAHKFVIAGMVLLVLRIPPWLGPGTLLLFRSGGFLCGFIALFLCLSVVRTSRLPSELLTEEQKAARDSFVVAIDLVVGIFLMATSFVK